MSPESAKELSSTCVRDISSSQAVGIKTVLSRMKGRDAFDDLLAFSSDCPRMRSLREDFRELSRAPESSEQFVWLNRRYGETETQLSRSAIMPSTRADSSQNAVI